MVSGHDFWIHKYEANDNYRNLFPYDHVVTEIYNIVSKLKRPIRVLELGCGCGNNLLMIPAMLFPQVLALMPANF